MNMDISCDIIRDLLPLYAENMVSEASKTMVDDHLCGCDECTKILGQIKKDAPIPLETGTETLSKVKKTIMRRRALSIMASVFTLITLASFVFTFLFAPFQLTKEQALDDFYVREDGAVVIDYSPYVTGRSMTGLNQNWYINQYSTRYDIWKGNNRKSVYALYGSDGVVTEEERQRYEGIEIIYGKFESADGKVTADSPIPWEENGGTIVEWESEKNWWYSDPAGLGNDTLLHDAGQERPLKEDRMKFAPIYPILFFGGIALSLVLSGLHRLTKKPWAKELSIRLLMLSGSVVFSTLFVSNGRIFTSYVGVIDQYWGPMIGTNTVFLTLTVLFWRQLYLLNKQDKGE